jgi:hypothetical protein
MKKIFTLLFAVALFVTANAQNGKRDRDDWNNNRNGNDIARGDNRYDRDHGYNNGRFERDRRMNREIARINSEYDFKMHRVRNAVFMNRFEKQRQLRQLQNMREREIRRVHLQFRNKGRY